MRLAQELGTGSFGIRTYATAPGAAATRRKSFFVIPGKRGRTIFSLLSRGFFSFFSVSRRLRFSSRRLISPQPSSSSSSIASSDARFIFQKPIK